MISIVTKRSSKTIQKNSRNSGDILIDETISIQLKPLDNVDELEVL